MLQLQFMGSAFSGDKPQDFYEEINSWLKIKLIIKVINFYNLTYSSTKDI